MSQSRDIIGTDKVTDPGWAVAIIHPTLPVCIMTNQEIQKNRRKNSKLLTKVAQEVGFMRILSMVSGRANVRLVGFVRVSASKLLKT